MLKYLSLKYLLITEKTGTLAWAVQKFDFLGPHFGGVPGGGGWYPQTMSKYFSLTYLLISKKNGTLGYMVKKICFWGGPFGGVPGGVVPPNYVKIFVSQISTDIKKNWHPSLSCSKNWFFGAPFWGGPRGGGWYPQTMSKYFSLKYLLISKKNGTLGYMVKKICFWGVHLGGSPGGWYPQIMSKYLSLKYLLISKKTGTLAWAVQKFDFLGPHFGGVPGGGGGTPKPCLNISLLNIYWYQRKMAP